MAPRPIGYWLKELDRLLDATLTHALASEQCNRRHWQLLASLEAQPADADALEAAVAPFAAADPGGTRAALTELQERGWVASSADGLFQLTAIGREAHARLQATVSAHRRLVSEGVSEQEYRTTVTVLERMAGNLERFLGPAR